MPALVPLIETTRGNQVENLHFGALAVSDAEGRLLAAAGDPQWRAFTRSTIKPFQALPLIEGGGALRFGYTREDLALLCASHSGEPMHVAQVQQMLDKAGVTVRQLQCGCHVPLFVDAGAGPRPDAFDERHHNCSGKHAGFLAWCVQQGQPLHNYLAPAHPLQQAVRRTLAEVAGLETGDLAMGVDGCSAPNYALPLAALARAFARLARGAADPVHGESFALLGDAMTAHPELVSGTGRNDLAFMRAGRGDWIAKAGADGVQVVASRSRGQALAVKVADGHMVSLYAATVAALDQLGWLDARQRDELRPWRAEAIANLKGTRVGERRPAFRLERP